MLDDAGLRSAILRMRRGDGGWSYYEDVDGMRWVINGEPQLWPYVEHLCEIDGRPAWLVDDRGRRYVVVNGFVWDPSELGMAAPKLRAAAEAAIARLDEFNQGRAA